jgi:hypothetical protein
MQEHVVYRKTATLYAIFVKMRIFDLYLGSASPYLLTVYDMLS